MQQTAWALAFALSLAGCASQRPPTGFGGAPDEPSGSGLVWVVDAAGHDRTLWVSTDDARPLASQPIEGPLWAVGSALWQWVDEAVEVPLHDCESGEVAGIGVARRIVLRDLTRPADVGLREAPSVSQLRELGHEVRAVGSAGPFVFVVERLTSDACGAHPTTHARAIVWDLREARPVDLLVDAERDALASAEVPAARERLRLEQGDDEAELDEVQLVALFPEWNVARGLALAYGFVAEVCHACGDGEWSSYTIATRIEATRLPARLEEHALVPRWVRDAVAHMEGARLVGFTRIEHPAPARVLDALRR